MGPSDSITVVLRQKGPKKEKMRCNSVQLPAQIKNEEILSTF